MVANMGMMCFVTMEWCCALCAVCLTLRITELCDGIEEV